MLEEHLLQQRNKFKTMRSSMRLPGKLSIGWFYDVFINSMMEGLVICSIVADNIERIWLTSEQMAMCLAYIFDNLSKEVRVWDCFLLLLVCLLSFTLLGSL